MNGTRHFRTVKTALLVLGVGIILLSWLGRAAPAQGNESLQQYKMLSSVEYSGKTQFSHQVESLFNVRKQVLPDNKVKYVISSDNFDLVGDTASPAGQPSSNELSFVIDKNTGFLSDASRDLGLLEEINNQCVGSLKKITKQNIGKTWKHSFGLSSLSHVIPEDLRLTLTAIRLETKLFGELIAVRALSEPFIVKAMNAKGGEGSIKSRINAVYVFDSNVENIYLSISVFEAQTSMNGTAETLRHEIATYKTNAAGVSVDLSGLGETFEGFVRKVGLSKKGVTVTKKGPLPQWTKVEGLSVAQVSNICAATACEGAPNPVATISIPAARTVAMQTFGTVASSGTVGTISTALATRLTGVTGAKIAIAPAMMGIGAGPTAAIVGGGAAIAAGSGGGGGGSDARSPSTP
jgi:hypothetical protein